MGKAIGQIEKHPICVGTANESAISERVQQVKDAWKASVKQRKGQDAPPSTRAPAPPTVTVVASNSANKRTAESDAPSPAASVKKVKTAAPSFSTLLKKVSGSNGSSPTKPLPGTPTKGAKSKGSSKYVKWADHFGGQLSASQLIDSEGTASTAVAAEASVSWSDRKKRDRMREKELLSKVKYVEPRGLLM
jgi:hypothetical protein